MEYTRDTEPPLAFHKWTAIGCISSALQRRVYIKWGMDLIRPNLYIILVGPSAQTRKSTALMIGRDLVKSINVPMIGQDNSPEAVIREIKSHMLTYHEGSQVRFQSALACFASELAVFLGRQNNEFQAYLTDWYDSPDDWKRTTKHQGIDDITGLCFNLIGAMAPDWIPHIFLPESIGGGFTSRIIFVAEARKAKTVVNPNKMMPTNGRRTELLHDLEMIHTMVGEYYLSDAAESFYEEWYSTDDARVQEGDFPIKDPAFHHYCGRRGTLLKKISMVMAASAREGFVIEKEDIQKALEAMEEAERKMAGLFASVGRSAVSRQGSLISNYVRDHKGAWKSEILREFLQDISLEALEDVEKTLEVAKMIKVVRDTEKADTRYEWIL